MTEYPKHLILSNKVYNLSVFPANNSSRAFNRGLIDFHVEGQNPLSNLDKWKTLLGMTEELSWDYPGFKQPIPLEWILFRFLSHYVRTNSTHILAGTGGEVLTTTTFKEYLGRVITDNEAEQMLRVILRRNINALKFLGHIEEINQDTYKVKPSIFDNLPLSKDEVSLDRKINRYYQEIKIEAIEPFCFVIMPFKEIEFFTANLYRGHKTISRGLF